MAWPLDRERVDVAAVAVVDVEVDVDVEVAVAVDVDVEREEDEREDDATLLGTRLAGWALVPPAKSPDFGQGNRAAPGPATAAARGPPSCDGRHLEFAAS